MGYIYSIDSGNGCHLFSGLLISELKATQYTNISVIIKGSSAIYICGYSIYYVLLYAFHIYIIYVVPISVSIYDRIISNTS